MIDIPVSGLANINSLDYYGERNELTIATGLIKEIDEQLKRKCLAQKSYPLNPAAFFGNKIYSLSQTDFLSQIKFRKEISVRIDKMILLLVEDLLNVKSK